MKKFLFIALLSFQFMNAQDSTSIRKNEVRFDLLSLITSSKFNISYERTLAKRYSAGLSASYANSQKINDDFDTGYRNTIPKYEITPFVRYNLSKGQTRFYFAEVFMMANGGDFKETVRILDGATAYYVNQKSNYFDLALGGGLGYKMYFKEKFVVELLVGFGSNLFNKEKSPDVVSRVGLNFGYRF